NVVKTAAATLVFSSWVESKAWAEREAVVNATDGMECGGRVKRRPRFSQCEVRSRLLNRQIYRHLLPGTRHLILEASQSGVATSFCRRTPYHLSHNHLPVCSRTNR